MQLCFSVFKSQRLGRDIFLLRLVFPNSRVFVQKLCLLFTAFQAVEAIHQRGGNNAHKCE